MKKLILIAISLLTSFGLKSQSQNPVTWQISYKTLSATEGEISLSAKIEKGWHTYSQRATDAGPIPTSFKFTPSKSYQTIGKTEESNAHEEFVKAFDAKIFVFTANAEFKQKIKLLTKTPTTIAVNIEYMCCNDMMCLPPKTIELTVKTN